MQIIKTSTYGTCVISEVMCPAMYIKSIKGSSPVNVLPFHGKERNISYTFTRENYFNDFLRSSHATIAGAIFDF